MKLETLIGEHREWSHATFGDGLLTKRITNHIRKELVEIEEKPHDLEEWIDVMLLAIDGAWRTGATPEEIAAQLWEKLMKNKERTWIIPHDLDAPIEHNRGHEER